MTTITVPRSLIEQAVVALSADWAKTTRTSVANALTAALAQQAEPVGINGLTHSEESETASVRGIIGTAAAPTPPLFAGLIAQHEGLAEELRAQDMPTQQAEPVGWRPIATAPKDGTDVLIHYVTEHGRHVRCIAHWTAANTVESSYNNDDDVGEYDEATDAWYVPEGWYENLYNWDEYRSVFIHEGKPDSWQPMPNPPESSNG